MPLGSDPSSPVRPAFVLVLSLIFLAIFAALAVCVGVTANGNLQMASNQASRNSALAAAQSGLQCARYLVATVGLPNTAVNQIRPEDSEQVWSLLIDHLSAVAIDGRQVQVWGITGGQVLRIADVPLDDATFSLAFYRYYAEPNAIFVRSTGRCGDVYRTIGMRMDIKKKGPVLRYGVASRGRMWLTGDTTVYGPIYSSWDVESISPFNMTSDSRVFGSINTVLTLDQVKAQSWQLETLDEHDRPIDVNGAPLGTNYQDRYYGPDDEIQGYHEGINYGQPDYENIPELDIANYDTSLYREMAHYDQSAQVSGDLICNGKIPASSVTITEYFPHAAGSYTQPRDSGSLKLKRYLYENKTFRDVFLPSIKTSTTDRRAALFRNCTFEGILYIDCAQTASSTVSNTPYNNVRFENCTFKGVIVTNTPRTLWSNWWKQNCLYFTGAATFNNQSAIKEATILAPHFNVNLGNTNPQQSDNNVLTGVIVGGIVDVRGNAQIYGTIVSMADTTCYTSGYVTNIGATLSDGGSETTELGDVGTIVIRPDPSQMLPSGITTPIVIEPDQSSYQEIDGQ